MGGFLLGNVGTQCLLARARGFQLADGFALGIDGRAKRLQVLRHRSTIRCLGIKMKDAGKPRDTTASSETTAQAPAAADLLLCGEGGREGGLWYFAATHVVQGQQASTQCIAGAKRCRSNHRAGQSQ